MSPQRNRLVVFVVDDECVIATTLEMILIRSGFDARSFVESMDALEAADFKAPDLLISDVVMPRMNGVQLAIQVALLCPECKILLFSGQASTLDLLADAKSKGHHFDLLDKPVHPSQLLEKITAMFAA